MKKVLKLLVAVVSIFQSSAHIIACDDKEHFIPNGDFFNLIAGTNTNKIITTVECKNTIFVLDDANNIFESDSNKPFVKLNTSNITDKINNLVVDNNGKIFISTNNTKDEKGNIYQYNKTSKKFDVILIDKFKKPILLMVFDKKNHLYIVDEILAKSRIRKINITENIKEFKVTDVSKLETKIRSLIITKSDNIFIISITGEFDKLIATDNKYKIEEQAKLTVDDKGKIIKLITIENDIYVLYSNDKSSSVLYKLDKTNEKWESQLTIPWVVNDIVTDGKHFYFNSKDGFVSATNDENTKFIIFNEQKVGNITSLFYDDNYLIVANSQGQVYESHKMKDT